MSFISRASQVAAALFKKSDQSIRGISKETEIPKSSVHRHRVGYKKRVESVGHDFFETPTGRDFLQRLFFAVIFIFGIQAGVGSKTISLFFTAMMLTCYIASSPSSIRHVKQQMRQLIAGYDASMMEKLLEACKDKELHLGGDETFFDNQLFLVAMELTSGFIFTEELTKDRQYRTWSAVTKSCLGRLNNIASMAIDKGRSLLKFGKSITSVVTMDLFHLLQDITRAFGAQFSAKHRSLVKQEAAIDKDTTLSSEEKEVKKSDLNKKRESLLEGEKAYKDGLFLITTLCHPFSGINQSHSSFALTQELNGTLTALRRVMSDCNISDNRKLMTRCENRITMLSGLNDSWHQWVESALQDKTQDAELQDWARNYLLPWCYWKWQLSKSKRKAHLKKHYQEKVDQAFAALSVHPMRMNNLTDEWKDWGKAMSLKYQRTTSAVEGRNARLSYHYFSSKGIRSNHVKPLTTIHNFWLKRRDNTTACERLCGIKPPDLFEWLLTQMNPMPIPRERQPRLVNS